jgi:signal transduction histidine kinase
MVRNVLWGGDPNKPAAAGAHGHLHPRKSFEKWKEEVRLRSCAWTNSDLDGARELRRCVVEIDLERQLTRARHAVRVRDDLVAVVSHDLRNPLSVIQMQTALLLNSTVRAQDEPVRRLRAAAERTQRAIDRMNGLITSLLDLAKIEAGRFELSRRPEIVHDVLVEAIAVVRPLAEAKHVAIDEVIDESCVASVDRERFFQVVADIIGNAIKFTPENGRIMVESGATDDELIVSIADTGPGIPDDAIEHVFERYWQAPRSKRRTGSGLGLYIAKGIVEAHGGRIWVDRAQTGGAMFRFTIPCA